jgi:transcriptional regulator with PAS, ATPase and Fis domain
MLKSSSDHHHRRSDTGSPRQLIGVSAAMIDIVQLAERAAASDAKVLLTGESGVGKDVIAHMIHEQSQRARGAFIAVNCAGLTESLLESELFGHEKGSFTGAYRERRGTLEMAHGGTLFLDEVGEMSLRMQALLLRFLETGELQRVGGSDSRTRADVRIVAATNRSLPERVSSGDFREDLLYRLRVIHIHVPPLRDRHEDIRPLVAHFTAAHKPPVEFSPEALALLERYRWPGNVRELQNVVEQAIWQAAGPVVEPMHLPPCIHAIDNPLHQRERRRQTADDLYDGLVNGKYLFWDHVYPFFLSRDITRHDIRELVRRGLVTTRGSYRGLLDLFGMRPEDYQRFHNFLAAHECKVEFREFRTAESTSGAVPRRRKKLEVPSRETPKTRGTEETRR